MFPTAESAYFDVLAAVMLANVSGKEVPNATKVIAVTDGWIPSTHPRIVATSPTIAVISPIKVRAMKKVGTPPDKLDGGTMANSTFQNMVMKCKIASDRVTSSRIKLSSSIYGPSNTAFLNC